MPSHATERTGRRHRTWRPTAQSSQAQEGQRQRPDSCARPTAGPRANRTRAMAVAPISDAHAPGGRTSRSIGDAERRCRVVEKRREEGRRDHEGAKLGGFHQVFGPVRPQRGQHHFRSLFHRRCRRGCLRLQRGCACNSRRPASKQHHEEKVLVLGGGFGGRLRGAGTGKRAWHDPESRSRSSTVTTSSSSRRCSTRWRRATSNRPTSSAPSAHPAQRRVLRRRGRASRPAGAAGDGVARQRPTHPRPAVRLPGDRPGIDDELLRAAGARGAGADDEVAVATRFI